MMILGDDDFPLLDRLIIHLIRSISYDQSIKEVIMSLADTELHRQHLFYNLKRPTFQKLYIKPSSYSDNPITMSQHRLHNNKPHLNPDS